MIRNFVLESANAPGTNLNVLLAGPKPDRQSWRQAYADNSPVFYFIDDGTMAEWGVGAMHWGTPNFVSRDTVIGNTTGTTSRMNFIGAVDIYNEIPGERMPFINQGVIWGQGARLDPHAGGVPVGASIDYWGTVAPTGWLFCDGRWASRTDYALLFSVIGTTYGAADGAANFALPDCQGAATYGKDTPAAGGNTGNTRLGPWQKAQGATMGASIGDWRLDTHTHGLNWSDPGHAHAVADPGHTHGVVDPGHIHGYRVPSIVQPGGLAPGATYNVTGQGGMAATDDGGVRGVGIGINASGTGIGIFGSGTGISASIANAGSGIGWNNVSPGIVCNKIIYAGPVP